MTNWIGMTNDYGGYMKTDTNAWYDYCKVKYLLWVKRLSREQLLIAARDTLRQRLTTTDELGIVLLNAKSLAIRTGLKK